MCQNNDKNRSSHTLTSIINKLESNKVYSDFNNKVIPAIACIIQNKQMEKLFYIVEEELKLNKLATRIPSKILYIFQIQKYNRI